MPLKILPASGSGSATLISVAGTTTNDTLTLPARTGNIITSADTGTVTPSMLSTGAPTWTSGGQVEFPDGTAAAPAITNSGDTNTGIYFPAADTIAFAEGGAESARFDSSGNLLVGKTASNGTVVGVEAAGTGEVRSTLSGSSSATSSFELYSTGAGAFRFYVNMAGTIFATSTTISAISDRRFKENIVDLDVGLDALLALKPRKFDWKDGKGRDIKGDRGWIADEFQQVFPDLIDEWKDAPPEGEEPYKAVRPDLIPVLVKAIQELSAELNEAKARIAALEAK